MINPHEMKAVAKKQANKNIKFRSFLKNNADPKELDQQFRDLHNELFVRDGYDCCQCANCCKVYDIQVTKSDIPAIAEYLGQTEKDFIETYLKQDEEASDLFLMRDKPCHFLEANGKCRIYNVRPLVCREYPHTKKPDRLFSLLGIIGFAEDCPVVFEILERLKKIYRFR